MKVHRGLATTGFSSPIWAAAFAKLTQPGKSVIGTTMSAFWAPEAVIGPSRSVAFGS